MKHHEEKIKNLSVDQMSAYLYSLSNTLSVKNNQKDFVYVLKAYMAKILSSNSGENGKLRGEMDLEKFYQTLLHLEKKEVLLYDNEFKYNYYTTLGFFPGGLSADVYSFYSDQLKQKTMNRRTGIINTELYIKTIVKLHEMADEVKPKDVSWKINTLYDADQILNRVIDPVFEKMIELYGLSVINHKDAKRSWVTAGNKNCIEEIIFYKAKPYLNHLYQIAKSENKTDVLSRWVKEALAKPVVEGHDYAKSLIDEIEIQKEQRQVKGLMDNFNKKKIKQAQKVQKEKNSSNSISQLSGLRDFVFSSENEATPTPSPMGVASKTKKYKL